MSNNFTFTPTVAASPLTTNAYASISRAQEYFDTILNTDAWDDASTLDKNKALTMATRAIDQLAYQGIRTAAAVAAGNEFPRYYADFYWSTPTPTIPEAVINACCEEALSLLSGADPNDNLMGSQISSESYASVKVTYDGLPQPHEISGITSPAAWRLLLPYIKDKRNLTVYRV